MADKKIEEKLEREYTIPLRHRWNIVPTYKRANKAVKAIKEFLVRHMKIRDRDLSKIKIEKSLNEAVWMRGIKHPPARIKVKAIKEGDIVRVEGIDMPTNIKFKKIREEKIKAQSQEIAKKKKAVKAEEKPEEADKNANGIDDKKEEKEDKTSTVEGGEKIQEAKALEEKHTTKEKSPKEQKNMKVSYNQSSRGH
jgi:large subunit ribosomal protein L31e